MMFQDAQVKIVKVDKENGMVELQIGCEGYTIPISTIKDMLEGINKPIECLLYNIAVRLALSRIDLSDLSKVKTAIESTTFKW